MRLPSLSANLVIALLACAVFIALPANAANLTWTNSGSGDWFDQTNWSPTQVPAGNDYAYFNSGTVFIVSGNAVSAISSIGYGVGDSGAVVVSGNGQWDAGRLSVGVQGVGALTITENGIVRSNAFNLIASKDGSGGLVTVSGNGQWHLNLDGLYLGTGTLTLRDQAVVSALFIGSTNGDLAQRLVNLHGGTLRTGGVYVPINLHGGAISATGSSNNFFNGLGDLTLSGSGLAADKAALTFNTNGHAVTATNNFTFVNEGYGVTNAYRALEKTGSGTLTLTGNNNFLGTGTFPANYKGDVWVTGGNLTISGIMKNDIGYIRGDTLESSVTISGDGVWENRLLSISGTANGSLVLADRATLSLAWQKVPVAQRAIILGDADRGIGQLVIASDQVKIQNDAGVPVTISGTGTRYGNAVIFTHSGSLTLDANTSGLLALKHIGSGTTVLTGTLRNTSMNELRGGTLLIDGDASTIGFVIYADVSGVSLGGSGTINGFAFGSADTTRLLPGAEDSVGTLTLTGNGPSKLGNANAIFDLADSGHFDRVISSGTIFTDGRANFTINFFDTFDYAEQTYSFDLMQGLTGDFTTQLQWQNLDPQWSILNETFLDGVLTFELLQIPEPSGLFLLAIGVATLAVTALRRRVKKFTRLFVSDSR